MPLLCNLGFGSCLNPRTYTRSHTPNAVQEEVDGNPPWVCDMLQYFETILPSVERLWSSLQDKEYYMDGGAAGGLWQHQTLSPSWILSRIKNKVKTVGINNFLRLTCKITHINYYFALWHPQVLLLLFKKVKKNMHFHSKMAWPPATYDVISRNHRNWPSLILSQNVRVG